MSALAAAGLLLTAGLAAAPSASAATGTRSLAAYLTAGGNGTFDSNGKDYDIVTQAVLAVLKAKPDSAVKVLTDGTTAATAFLPTDNAFRILVKDLTGKSPKSEKDVFAAVLKLGVPTVETVLLYHVIPGKTLGAVKVIKSLGSSFTTAQGGSFQTYLVADILPIGLKDKDPNARDAHVKVVNLNYGNKQIAHGVDRVLRPLDL
ncbi:fasciclin domain-containing protein [Spongisporangium articulatum]|uniref:Fasciclin domain-containing protein n=1 Tax=Spongisporangium articulatum TaxID=3362603 RepID=A0ABW8AQT2_9ACTN